MTITPVTPVTPVTPTTKKHCFAHNHMTMREFGLWNRIRALQSRFGFVYFDADDLSAGFVSTSRDVIYDDCTRLLDAGWLQLLQPRKRKKDGTWEARKLTALSHKDWQTKYPDKCLTPQDDHSANSDWNHSANSDAPVGKQRLTSRQIAIDHSANSDAPVAPRRQRLCSKSDIVQPKQDSKKDIVQSRALEGFSDRSSGSDSFLEKSSNHDLSDSSDRQSKDSPKNHVMPPDAVAEIWDDGVLTGWQLKNGSEVML